MYKKEQGQRLDRVLQGQTGLSRKKVKALLDQGRAFVNGRRVVIASWEVGSRDRVEVREEAPLIPSGDYYLKVVYEDPDLLVIEKDPGISCEPSSLDTRPTIVSIINGYLKRKSPHLKRHYLGLVHRLDRDTSGLMVYTKTPRTNRPMAEQFKRHSIRRRYLAVVQGRVERETGRIEGYLKKSSLLPGGRKVALSTPASGRTALTSFQVLERYANSTLAEVTLNTGRTHQIRVQMASIGHPVVGDKIYGKPVSAHGSPLKAHGENHPAASCELRAVGFPRQALHACFLGFRHPATGQKMEFSSELPHDLRKLVDRLRAGS